MEQERKRKGTVLAKERVFSGIQPTGELHIGNYLGATRNWASLIDRYDCIYCIVDYHAMTIDYDVPSLQERIRNVALDNIACGLDPDKCTLFVQSDVPQVTELTWILSTVTPMGDLNRMTQYKEKSKQHEDNINAGLFTYPILQTADIIIYKATHVPVGEDQVQHVELAREIVRDFNRKYGDVFPEPVALLTEAKRILGLDGTSKMSKSLGNHIGLTETRESLSAKLMPAKTVESRKRRNDPGDPDICVPHSYHKYMPAGDDIALIEKQCRAGEIGCVEHKKMIIEAILSTLAPVRQKRTELQAKKGYVEDVLAAGAQRCRKIADETMADVRKACGISKKG